MLPLFFRPAWPPLGTQTDLSAANLPGKVYAGAPPRESRARNARQFQKRYREYRPVVVVTPLSRSQPAPLLQDCAEKRHFRVKRRHLLEMAEPGDRVCH